MPFRFAYLGDLSQQLREATFILQHICRVGVCAPFPRTNSLVRAKLRENVARKTGRAQKPLASLLRVDIFTLQPQTRWTIALLEVSPALTKSCRTERGRFSPSQMSTNPCGPQPASSRTFLLCANQGLHFFFFPFFKTQQICRLPLRLRCPSLPANQIARTPSTLGQRLSLAIQ